ncbi:GntR family transcriptional regulator [Rhizobium sp. ZPR3]|uniref:GntR family transcriptional regulator n=2 Tax=unclassified Rhizobium TaxID=2613769 RepID=A0AAU7S9R2_9HYPH
MTLFNGSPPYSEERIKMPPDASHEARSSAAIYSQLKEMVVSYAFSPSQQLQPWSLADAFKVSATPVREALIRLNAEGLVMTHPNKGFFMKPLNVAENCELYVLRSQLVKCSVEHIIDHAQTPALNWLTESWLSHLEIIREGGASAPSSLELFFEDCLRAAGSGACFEVVRGVHEKTRYLRSLFIEQESQTAVYFEILEELAYTVRERNKQAAAAKIRDELEFKLKCVPGLCDAGLIRAFRCQ